VLVEPDRVSGDVSRPFVQLCTLESERICRPRNGLAISRLSAYGTIRSFFMASIYDAFADSCGALAAKAKSESDKVRLLQLADQWRTVPADRQGLGKKPPASVVPVTDNVNRHRRIAYDHPRSRPRVQSAVRTRLSARD
jgi:hypothetical protein